MIFNSTPNGKNPSGILLEIRDAYFRPEFPSKEIPDRSLEWELRELSDPRYAEGAPQYDGEHSFIEYSDYYSTEHRDHARKVLLKYKAIVKGVKEAS